MLKRRWGPGAEPMQKDTAEVQEKEVCFARLWEGWRGVQPCSLPLALPDFLYQRDYICILRQQVIWG